MQFYKKGFETYLDMNKLPTQQPTSIISGKMIPQVWVIYKIATSTQLADKNKTGNKLNQFLQKY